MACLAKIVESGMWNVFFLIFVINWCKNTKKSLNSQLFLWQRRMIFSPEIFAISIAIYLSHFVLEFQQL
jgi:hypothetical protein